MKLTLLSQLLATLFMVGLIWFVQVVHYPLFANVGREQFTQYEALHRRLITWVVGPVMLLELTSAVALIRCCPTDFTKLAWIGLGLLGVIWISTAALSVPAHDALSAEFSTAAWQRLVSTNWIRTITWSLRGFIVLSITYRALGVETPPNGLSPGQST